MPFGPSKESSKEFNSSWELYGNSKQKNVDGNLSILDKYKPKNLSQLFRNKDNIRLFQEWTKLKFEKKKTYDYALITGEPGTGKTEFIRLCFQNLNFSVIEYDQSINKAELGILFESITFSNIEILFSGRSRKGIVIDNFQNNLSTTQLNDLLKLLKKTGSKSSPTIFVCSDNIKSSNILKGNVLHIEFQPPKIRDLTKLGERIRIGESLNITPDVLKQYTQDNKNLRDFLSTFTFITEDCKISTNKLQKDVILDTQNTIRLFVEKCSGNFNDRIKYTSMHTSSIIQENYLDAVTKNTSLEDLSKMSDWVSLGDIFKTYMVSNQSWELSELCGIVGTEAPSSLIRSNYRVVKKFKIPNRFDSRYEISIMNNSIQDLGYCLSYILFPLDPNKNWIKNMNESAKIFREFMERRFIDKDKAVKILGVGYAFQDHPPNIVRKVRTKFRNEWKIK